MIVDQNDGRSRVLDRGPEDFSGVNQTGVQGANSDLMRIDDLVFCIQRDDMKLLLFGVRGKPGKKSLAKYPKL